MQKLGILTSILLLTAAVVGPVGLSYAQTVDTHKEAKLKHEQLRAKLDQERADRLEAQKQKAAEIREKMQAKKMEAAKELEKMSGSETKQQSIPRAAEYLAALKAKAAEEIAAKKAAVGPSKVQVALEKDRADHEKRIQEYKKTLPTTPEKDLKYLKEENQNRMNTLKKLGASDQAAKEKLALEQQKKAEELKKQKYGEIHYNRK
ncbi:hypothetical protein [Candidatus Nitrosotenuis uzonensis]|uniref:Uncharacterized protein n=1 Tax=Candidatus Nitrosotenuis uzonensis TaxID=1407055 RepID=V6ASI6_9ARCH|nr:hypothetical protein [Candidatus Nitrosotenuis uzonensis]CDI05500.1 exported hypothetical protein [Candidatus Nitrosotenuis uzonensis]